MGCFVLEALTGSLVSVKAACVRGEGCGKKAWIVVLGSLFDVGIGGKEGGGGGLGSVAEDGSVCTVIGCVAVLKKGGNVERVTLEW